eukprot:gnl/MRDRNA2_/MRDRNA2_70541_c0_seq1.p1 gnl/MRDRNA2_/MRDRNA2_70541_c0~~gnl/MRDRNA2_/MRDRNA2_70541_c0_seq1.p1  ORF type:complete len:212 (+),score=37.37 gnl/MRDRNA2_/MRDRNA2_70541_c0_seq1:45-680(+)
MINARPKLVALTAAVVASATAVALALRLSRGRRRAVWLFDEGRESFVAVGVASKDFEPFVDDPRWEVILADSQDTGLPKDIMVLRRAGCDELFAVQRACPHAGIDLLGGDIEALPIGCESSTKCSPKIACPAHTYIFDVRSGQCIWDAGRTQPAETPPLARFKAGIGADGMVYVRRQEDSPADLMLLHQGDSDQLQLDMVDKALGRKFGDL